MKRKPFVIVLCIAVLCGALVYAFIPRDVAPQADRLEIWRVQRMVGDAEFEDITSQINSMHLPELLTSCKASRLPFYQSSYPIDTVLYEIDGRYDGKPLHFVLGKNSFVYESTPWNYRLHDAQALIDTLDAMLANAATE